MPDQERRNRGSALVGCHSPPHLSWACPLRASIRCAGVLACRGVPHVTAAPKTVCMDPAQPETGVLTVVRGRDRHRRVGHVPTVAWIVLPLPAIRAVRLQEERIASWSDRPAPHLKVCTLGARECHGRTPARWSKGRWVAGMAAHPRDGLPSVGPCGQAIDAAFPSARGGGRPNRARSIELRHHLHTQDRKSVACIAWCHQVALLKGSRGISPFRLRCNKICWQVSQHLSPRQVSPRQVSLVSSRRHTGTYVATRPQRDARVVRGALELVLELGRHNLVVVQAAWNRIVILSCNLQVRIEQNSEFIARIKERPRLPNTAAPSERRMAMLGQIRSTLRESDVWCALTS